MRPLLSKNLRLQDKSVVFKIASRNLNFLYISLPNLYSEMASQAVQKRGKIAVIGGGISGLTVGWCARSGHVF